jgi:hypothetical protein
MQWRAWVELGAIDSARAYARMRYPIRVLRLDPGMHWIQNACLGGSGKADAGVDNRRTGLRRHFRFLPPDGLAGMMGMEVTMCSATE